MKKPLLLLFALFSFGIVPCQIVQKAIPFSELYGKGEPVNNVPVHYTPSAVYTRSNKKAGPLRAGVTIPFKENLAERGTWESLPDGRTSWKVKITVPEARQINLYFSPFRLQTGDLLFVYPEGTATHEAFSKQNNGRHLATRIYNGNNLVIELNREVKSRRLPFQLKEIGIIIPENGRDFGNAGYCEIPVNCSEGDNYKNQKEGVARILVKEGHSLFWCTGSLVNNSEIDGTPYFLTANHCGENADENDYDQWLFYFNYEAEGCERPATEPEIHSLSGARLLAHAPNSTSAGSDFKLLKLNNEVPKEYHPYFNGWDHSGAISGNGVTIHHPEGDIKMISTYTTDLTPVDYYGTVPNTNGLYWKVQWSETENGHGVTEGGSSGSPLFNADGLIIGALTGGEAACTNADAPDYYGRFSKSWKPAGSDSTGQLAYWLDPTGAYPDILPGYDPNAGEVVPSFIADITTLPEGGETVFKNLSYGNVTGYRWTFYGGDPSSSEQKNPPPVTYNKRGKYDVELTVTYNGGEKTVKKQQYIEVTPAVYPNPTPDGIVHVRMGEYAPDSVSVNVYTATGRELGIFKPEFTPSEIVFNFSKQKAGIYFIRITVADKIKKYKVLYTASE